jgi:sensor histidine kinase YesM
MKLRWREHEFIFASALALFTALGYLWSGFGPANEKTQSIYLSKSSLVQQPINFYTDILLQQIASVVLLYLVYIIINYIITPGLQKRFSTGVKNFTIKNTIWPVVQVIATSYLLAIGINIISYYAHPHLYNYGGFQIAGLFGYNDRPLSNIFFGFDRAILMVVIITAYTYLRESVIRYLNRKASYRILVINQVTLLLSVFILVPFSLSAFDLATNGFLFYYTRIVPPVLLLYLSNTFWLFPRKGNGSFFEFAFIWRLLLTSFLYCILFFPILYLTVFIAFWAAVLLFTTPVSWILYQQRRDEIEELRKKEKELTRSRADLAFLQSQINPHFLFNALNTLYGTAIMEGSDRTAEGIQKLGDMMRFMLHENHQDLINMDKEIEYLQNYLSLQKLRVEPSSNISIEEDINALQCRHRIAPMLLIPFVENAFKHGISLKEKSWIKIRLRCDEHIINFDVSNSVHKIKENDPEKTSSGIGMKNVQERLKLLYPGRHSLLIKSNENEFIIHLSIQP